MTQWIPFVEGEYIVDRAYLLAPDNSAAALENVIAEVYSDRQGIRHVKGHCRVRNTLMIELLENNDDLDLILDFGDEFKYRLKTPELNAGKVFSPAAKSTLWFAPTTAWEQIPEKDFAELVTRLHLISE
jgi:hypothetical protein